MNLFYTVFKPKGLQRTHVHTAQISHANYTGWSTQIIHFCPHKSISPKINIWLCTSIRTPGSTLLGELLLLLPCPFKSEWHFCCVWINHTCTCMQQQQQQQRQTMIRRSKVKQFPEHIFNFLWTILISRFITFYSYVQPVLIYWTRKQPRLPRFDLMTSWTGGGNFVSEPLHGVFL